MELKITGTVKNVLPETRREYKEKIYISQSILVEEDKDQFPSTYKIEFSDKVNAFQYVKVAKSGDRVEISCEVQGRPYTNKQDQLDSFMSLKGFRYTKLGGNTSATSSTPPPIEPADDLPF